MERCVLTPSQLSRENVLTTYISLAKTFDQITVEESFGMSIILGDESLSFCNFIGGFQEFHDHGARMEFIAELTQKDKSLWAFVHEEDWPDSLSKDLLANGFVLRQSLLVMNWESVSKEKNSADSSAFQIHECLESDERKAIGKFMAEQFFIASNQKTRDKVEWSTEKSHHRLFSIWDRDKVVAAVMVVFCDNSIGLYNLCVAPGYRSIGYGKLLVQKVLDLAIEVDKPVYLQCNAPLIDYYSRLGFSPVCTLNAYLHVQQP